jgi:dipeptidyl-peptidase-4
MVSDVWGGGIAEASYFVGRGILVAEIDGRGSSGLGTAHVREVRGRLGLLELEDQVAAVKALTERPWIDGTRVGITGWSYGGTMVCLALTRAGDTFRVGVAGAPVTDWRLYDSIYTERYMGLPAENAEGYRASSVLEQASGLADDGRLLLIHAADDDNVHLQNTLALVDRLARANRAGFESMVYPRGGHGAGPYRRDVKRRTLDLLEDVLLAPRSR